MHPAITSHQNPKIKNLMALEKPRERRKLNVFSIEGRKEITLAMQAGYTLDTLFFCADIVSQNDITTLLPIPEGKLIPVSKDVFDKIAVRENSGGMVAIAQQKQLGLSTIALNANPLVLVLEAVEKPGNLGAILRTADAAGVTAVICCDLQTDFYNPNVIRSSLGCVFTNQVAAASSADTIAWLKENNIAIYCTYLHAAQPYNQCDYTSPCAFIMGTEATGLSAQWVNNATTNIIIPMAGAIDSMNVSTATAVVAFEARRQRGFV